MCRAPVGLGAKRTRMDIAGHPTAAWLGSAAMLVGAHVSPAGGPANAIARGVERECRAIQIFNQSPRAWKGRLYSDDEVAAYREALDGSPIEQLVIHAIYLINCASEDPEIRA